MKIAHIYIEEHNEVKQLNVPINGRFECSYNPKCLTLTKRIDDLSEYYQNVNISAIIGKNGTGKTTILTFVDNLLLSSDSSGIVIFYCDKKDTFYICNINMRPMGCVDISNSTGQSNLRYEMVKNHKEFIEQNKVKLVHINNLSAEHESFLLKRRRSHTSIFNLSLKNNTQSTTEKRLYFSKLLKYFKQYFTSDYFQENICFELSFVTSPLRIMYRAIESSLSSKGIEIVLPTLQRWSETCHDIPLFSENPLSNNLVGKNVLSILSYLSKRVHNSAEKQNILLLYLIYTFANLNLHHNSMSYGNMLRETVNSLNSRDNWLLEEIKRSSLSFNELENVYNEIDLSKLKGDLEYCLKDLFNLSKLIDDHGLAHAQVNTSVCKVEDYELIDEISEIISGLPNEMVNNIRLGWRGISTGELAYSHIFSETFHYLISMASAEDHSIIFIDEVDLYLHPEWQRVFIFKFITLINYCHQYSKSAMPQIIITTHSPIITGDFLPRDIVSLYEEIDEFGDRRTTVKPSLGFGTNISDLYLKGMHLKAIFGEHSKRHIDKIIKDGQEGFLTEFDKALIEQMSDNHIKKYLLTS